MLDTNQLDCIRLEVEEVASKNEVRSPKQTYQYRVTYSLRQIITTTVTDQNSRSFWLQVASTSKD